MKSRIAKSFLLFLLFTFLAIGSYLAYKIYDRIHPTPRISDSNTTIIGFNHIGITVLDLDRMLTFYQEATGYELYDRYVVSKDEAVNSLYGIDSLTYERAILKGPNMLLELTAFRNQQDSIIAPMPAVGPGMTHTCYQSSQEQSGFDRFVEAGADVLSRGGEPIDLGGYGVTYAYAHDPEGNMIELEQMSQTVVRLAIGSDWAEQNPIWMTQVALMSPDLPRLIEYYVEVLGIPAYRNGSYSGNPLMAAIANLDSASINAAWFGMDSQSKKLELMQYVYPPTSPIDVDRKITDLGYHYSMEVTDIQEEYNRLRVLGIDFISAPQKMKDFWEVFTKDVDGNYYSFRQAIESKSSLSIRNL